jgi:hypothetical protein
MPTPAGADTNDFRCNACGRYFNTESELRNHETECRLAKMSSRTGARDLAQEDRQSLEKNDHVSTREPFLHGKKK